MKLTDSDIITAARELRDEQNERLQVAPNPLKRSSRPTPLWWAATAAALVLGFVIGETHPLTPSVEGGESSGLQESVIAQSLPSLAGGVGGGSTEPAIIREVIHEVVHDTIYETRIVRVPVQQVMTSQAEPAPEPETPGCSMLCDDIRYDLLTGN